MDISRTGEKAPINFAHFEKDCNVYEMACRCAYAKFYRSEYFGVYYIPVFVHIHIPSEIHKK